MEFVKGEKEISIKWMLGLLKYLFHELVANGKLLGTLIMLTIFSALLQSLQSAFSKSSLSKIADAVVYMVLIIFALNSFYVVMTYARNDTNNGRFHISVITYLACTHSDRWWRCIRIVFIRLSSS